MNGGPGLASHNWLVPQARRTPPHLLPAGKGVAHGKEVALARGEACVPRVRLVALLKRREERRAVALPRKMVWVGG